MLEQWGDYGKYEHPVESASSEPVTLEEADSASSATTVRGWFAEKLAAYQERAARLRKEFGSVASGMWHSAFGSRAVDPEKEKRFQALQGDPNAQRIVAHDSGKSFENETGEVARESGHITFDVGKSTLETELGVRGIGMAAGAVRVGGRALGRELSALKAEERALAAERQALEARISRGVDGRIESAFAKIEPQHLRTGTGTTTASRAEARALGQASDDAGHLIANRLGGKGGSGYVVPQNPSVNRGAFRDFERGVAEEVAAGKDVYVRVVPRYEGQSTRPYEIVYQVRVDGKTRSVIFPNP